MKRNDREIYELYKEGVPFSSIAVKYGLREAYVALICDKVAYYDDLNTARENIIPLLHQAGINDAMSERICHAFFDAGIRDQVSFKDAVSKALAGEIKIPRLGKESLLLLNKLFISNGCSENDNGSSC